MYEIIKEQIENTGHKLEEILDKIYTLYGKDKLTKEEMEKLEELARQNAKAENSYAPLQEQIENIYTESDKIKADINSLKNQEETEEPTEPVEEYPEYKAPSGAHDAYNSGDKITYNSKKYVCKMDNCVWSPDVYPDAWEEVVESEG